MNKTPAKTDAPALDSRAILDSLRRLVRGLRIYARRCELHLGLSAAQLFALRKIHEAGALSMKALAQATLTDVSSVSVVAERLRAKGLLVRQRSTEDGRRVDLTLSKSGLALLKRSPDPLQTRLVRSLQSLPRRRRRALRQDLAKLVEDAGLDSLAVELFFEEKD
jgi:DNA-binding MarR family transcriptional regulator